MKRMLKWITMVAGLAAASGASAADLIEQVESYYNSIFVYRSGTYVTLAFGHEGRTYLESQRNTADLTELQFTYTRQFTAAAAYASKLERLLMIGMGGGSTSWYLHAHIPDAQVTSVELDPAVVALAEKYFGLVSEPNFTVVEQDGRLFLMRDENRYDVIFIDAYRGPFVPFHLLTREFYEIVEAHLEPGGFVAQNIEPTTMLFDSTHATLLSVFDTVDFFPSGGNSIAIAYDGPRRDAGELMERARARQAEYGFRYDLPEIVSSRRGLDLPGADIEILTDDFAPVNLLQSVETHNRKWE